MHGDAEWRHLVQLQWNSPSGTRNRLIGGHGTFLRSASKKLHDLSRDYHEVTIPTQIIPANIPGLGWVKPYPIFNSDPKSIDVFMNKAAPSIPVLKRHGYRKIPPDPFLISANGSPDWVLRWKFSPRLIPILQTKIPLDWILNWASNKSIIQNFLVGRWIGVLTVSLPLPGPHSKNSTDPVGPSEPLAPYIIDDQSTFSGLSDSVTFHVSPSISLDIADDLSAASDIVPLGDVYDSGFDHHKSSYLSAPSALSPFGSQPSSLDPESTTDTHSLCPDSLDYNQFSTASDPLCSVISRLDLPVLPQISSNQCITSLSLAKNISAIAVVRDYLRMIGSNVSSKIKTIEDMYDFLREESGVCMSQSCSFVRHGADMGFQVHTVCSPQSCNNYGACNNNLDSLAVLNNGNIQVTSTPELAEGNKGLFSGPIGFQIGDFICTYGGEVRLEDKSIGLDNKYLMQLAVRYLIDGSKSTYYGKFINHGCGALANARTQFMISTAQIFLGIVALKRINPHEQILLDYCGVVPNARNCHLSVLKVCKCLSCLPQGAPLTRSTRSTKKLTINDSLDKWNKAGRCPDMGAISSSQSSESDNSHKPITLELLSTLNCPRKKLTMYDNLGKWNKAGRCLDKWGN